MTDDGRCYEPYTRGPCRIGEYLVFKKGGAAVCEFKQVLGALCHSTASQVEDLMLELEHWSMELQRHCPHEWNQCSAVLLRCLSGSPWKHDATEMKV